MLYQRIDLRGPTAVGMPAGLPPELVGLADESLADISAATDPVPAKWKNTGFWPVTVNVPDYDPRAETLLDEYDVTLDTAHRTAVANQRKRALTAEEIAALPPAPPIVVMPADLWRRATDAEAQKIYDLMQSQPVRLRQLFMTASDYRSDDPLWGVLTNAAASLFGPVRASELLAPSN